MPAPDLTWPGVFAGAIIVRVAASVFPRRGDRAGFPWFWVTFPVTVIAAAAGLAGYAPVEFHPVMYLPLGDTADDVGTGRRRGLFFLVVFLVGAAASTWAWRRGRY